MRRQENSYHIDVDFKRGLQERKTEEMREISSHSGLMAPVDSDAAGLSVAADAAVKRTVDVAGLSVTTGET